MQNRDRDQMSRDNQSTSVGDVNRKTSSQIGKDKSDSSADFGKNSGRSDNLNEPNSHGSKSGGYDSSSKSNLGQTASKDNGRTGGSRH